MKLDLTSYTKIKSKWIKDLDMRPKPIKLLRKHIGKNLLDISLGSDFLDLTAKTKATKAKINKWYYIKLKKTFAQQRNYQQNEKATY